MDGLVAERQQIEGCVQVANGRMDVGGFHRVPAVQMHDVEVLAQADQPPEVLPVANAPIPSQAGDVRRAGDRRERHGVPAEVDVVARVTRMQGECRGSMADHFGDHLGIEPDACGLGIHSGPFPAEESAGIWMQHVHTDIPQYL